MPTAQTWPRWRYTYPYPSRREIGREHQRVACSGASAGVVATLARGDLRRSVSWSGSTRKASPDGGGRLWGGVDRAYRGVGRTGAAASVARASELRADPPAAALRCVRGLEVLPDRDFGEQAPPRDHRLREPRDARSVRLRGRSGAQPGRVVAGSREPHGGVRRRDAGPLRGGVLAGRGRVRRWVRR